MPNALRHKLEECQRQNRQIGFAVGSFGLVHAGTVHFLQQAREICSCLFAVILPESASSAAHLLRPEERVRLLGSLREVESAILIQAEQSTLEQCLKWAPEGLWFCSKSEADVPAGGKDIITRRGVNLRELPGDETCTTQTLLRRMAGGTDSPRRG